MCLNHLALFYSQGSARSARSEQGAGTEPNKGPTSLDLEMTEAGSTRCGCGYGCECGGGGGLCLCVCMFEVYLAYLLFALQINNCPSLLQSSKVIDILLLFPTSSLQPISCL